MVRLQKFYRVMVCTALVGELLFFGACVPPNLVNTSNSGAQDNGAAFSKDFKAQLASSTSVRLSWTANPAKYSRYTISQVNGPYEFTIGGVPGDIGEFYVKNGIAPETTVIFKIVGIKAEDDTLDKDRSSYASIEIPPVHGTWQLVNSAGPSPGSTTFAVIDPALTDATVPFVRLQWKNFGTSSVSTWKLFRSAQANSSDWTKMTPIYTGSELSYLDLDAMSSGKKYYYSVVGVDANEAIVVSSKETYVRVPPTHQVLVHRESANIEMCQLLRKTIDPENFNRCDFTGMGGTGTHYDFGKIIFVDRYETGINISTRPGSCGATETLAGLDPATHPPSCAYGTKAGGAALSWTERFAGANVGEVFEYYPAQHQAQRSFVGHPTVKTFNFRNTNFFRAVSAWSAQFIWDETKTYDPYWHASPFNSSYDESYAYALAQNSYTNAPKKVPASFIGSGFGTATWNNPCSLRTNTGFGKTRIPYRSEQVVYTAWSLPDEPKRYDATDSFEVSPTELERGDNSQQYGSCNTSTITSLKSEIISNDMSKEEILYPWGDLVPTLNSQEMDDYDNSVTKLKTPANYMGWGFVTGSKHSRNCVSRFGVQDAIGNVFEAVDVNMQVTDGEMTATMAKADKIRGTEDPSMDGYVMDGVMGPGGTSRALPPGQNNFFVSSASQSVPSTCVQLRDNYVSHFLPTLGLPFMSAGSHGALDIGTFSSSELGTDTFCVDLTYSVWDYHYQASQYAFTGGSAAYIAYWDVYHQWLKLPTYNQPNQNYSNGDQTAGRWVFVSMRKNNGAANAFTMHDKFGSRCVTEDQ